MTAKIDRRTIGYWIATTVLIAPMGAGGVADIVQPESVAKSLVHLGYPLYFGVILGIFKLLGMAVLLAPRLPRIKEWAYAGMGIDLIAAFASHAVVDGVAKDLGPPALFLVVLAASWHLRPSGRRL